jgi:hypothetical protein
MSDLRWCRQFPNGQPKPSWLVNCVPFKKIQGPGIPKPAALTPPTPPSPPLFACRYNQLENTGYLIYQLTPSCEGEEYNEFTFSATSLIVNGVEYITSPIVSQTIDVNTVNYVSANNSIVSGCTVGVDPTGVTYTNFVNFVNSIFVSFSLNDYSAQLSYVDFDVQVGIFENTRKDSFYIIYPENDTFLLRLRNSTLGPGVYIDYTNSGSSSNSLIIPNYWIAFECGYNVTNGQVIE